MTRPLFQLGSHQFDLPNGAPQTLERTAEYRWEGQERILREPAYQFVGPGRQEINLDGVLFPGFSGRQSTLESLRELAAKGQPQMLTDGLGRVYGRWAIASLREGQEVFAPGGGARRITFSMRLVRYGEDNPGAAASPLSVTQAALPSNLLQQFTGNFDIGLGQAFTAAGSALDLGTWAQQAANAVPAVAAKAAGFNLGQLASIARSVGNGDYVGAALNAFGMAGLSVDQGSVWGQLGIQGAQMVQQMAQGHGAPAMSVALEALRPATYQMMQTLGGGLGGANGLRNLVRDAATISTMLDVDPYVTAGVRQAVQVMNVLSSRTAVWDP